jgi:hypothetical protein
MSPGFPVRFRPSIKDDDHRTNGDFLNSRESVCLPQLRMESSVRSDFFLGDWKQRGALKKREGEKGCQRELEAARSFRRLIAFWI